MSSREHFGRGCDRRSPSVTLAWNFSVLPALKVQVLLWEGSGSGALPAPEGVSVGSWPFTLVCSVQA